MKYKYQWKTSTKLINLARFAKKKKKKEIMIIKN